MWTESLNNDIQYFNQYQQNKQLPLTSNHWIHKKTTTYWYADVNPGPQMGQDKKLMWWNVVLVTLKFMSNLISET